MTCAWCGREVDQTGATPEQPRQHCSYTHKTKAARRRRKIKELVQQGRFHPERCPRPDKVTLLTFEEAALNKWAIGQGMEAYMCACGGIHYGH